MPQHTNIHEAINAVMMEVGYVQKQKSQGLNYSYAGEAALISALRPYMVENEIVVHPSGVSGLTTDQFANKNQTIMTHVTGMFSFTFVHAPSQSSFTVTVLGEGMDSGDKASNKAMTAAYKYALRQTFMIETGDDPDTVPSTEYERSTRSKASAPKTSQKPAASAAPAASKQEPVNEAAEFETVRDVPMNELTGAELYYLQEHGHEHCGMDNKFHFKGRWEKRWGVTMLKQIPLTVAEFLDLMRDDDLPDGTAEPERAA